MPAAPPNKQQKTSKSGWSRKRSSPTASSSSPALSASAQRRLAESRRQSTVPATFSNNVVFPTNPGNPPYPDERQKQAMAEYAARMAILRQQYSAAEFEEYTRRAAVAAAQAKALHQRNLHRPAPAPSRGERTWNFPIPKRVEDNPFQEKDYELEVVRYMVVRDNETLSTPESMDSQPEVQWFMRPFLLDFLIEVHAQFRLRPEVLYLAMNLVDRYVSKRVVYKKHYQLVGCAALWTAAKFEEAKDKVPLVRELSEMCCKAYDESAFVQMEGHVLSTVGWNLGAPTAEAWLRLFNKEAREDQKTQDVTRFLMEVTLYHKDHVGIQAYDIATGAIMLGRFICNKSRRTDLLQSRAAIFDVDSAHRAFRVVYALDHKLQEFDNNVAEVLSRKYAPNHFSRASHIVREWYAAGNRYTDTIDMDSRESSYFEGLHPQGLRMDSRRGSWMSSSPSASFSCSSSDNGEEPLTPNTPVHEGVHPFSAAAAKENVAPTPTRAKGGANMRSTQPAMLGQKMVPQQSGNPAKWTNFEMQQHQAGARPALHPLPPTGDLDVPRAHHIGRRLSN